MNHSAWTRISVLLAVCTGVFLQPVWAAEAPLHNDKLATVEAALKQDLAPVSANELSAAVDRAAAITAVTVNSASDTPTLILEYVGDILVDIHAAASGNTLLIDLHNAVHVPNLRTMVIDGRSLVAGVEAKLASISPLFMTRLVVHLKEASDYEWAQSADTIKVTLHRKSESMTDSIRQGIRRQSDRIAIAQAALQEIINRSDETARILQEECGQVLLETRKALEGAKTVIIEAQLAELRGDSTSSLHALIADTTALDNALRSATSTFQELLTEQSETRARIEDTFNTVIDRVAAASPRLLEQLENASSAAALQQLLQAVSQLSEDAEKDLSSLQNRLADRETVVAAQVESLNKEASRYLAKATALNHELMQTSGVSTSAPTSSVTMALARLDEKFEELRDRTTPDSDTLPERLAALNQALESVTAKTVDLPVADREAFATLKDDVTSVNGPFDPPEKRDAPGENSLTRRTVPSSAKLAILSSTADASPMRTDDGIIVMAKQEEGTGITFREEEEEEEPTARRETTREGRTRVVVPQISASRPKFSLYNRHLPPSQDPLRQNVDLNFREMDLANVVSMLAQMGQINVIAAADVSGKVTAELKDIPLGRAIEIVLRMHGLGIVEEAGVYRITSWEEAMQQQRETTIVFLENAPAAEVKNTLDTTLAGDVRGSLVSVSASDTNNAVILSGPRDMVDRLEAMVTELDFTEPVIPTVTRPIKLNYSEPTGLMPVVQELLTEQGTVTADLRARHLVVTDIPIKVEEVEALIADLDLPVKQVSIESMIVDAQLEDDAQTGIQWILETISSVGDQVVGETTVTTDGMGNTTSTFEGTVVEGAPRLIGASSFLPAEFGSSLAFNILSGDIDLSALIGAEVRSNDAELLANPVILTVENKPAVINITEEFPYQELTETSAGGQIASTEFKEIGTILEVTPRVTHDDHIIAELRTKQSVITGISTTGVPIEAKREADTTMMVDDGQTIFIGGLRRFDDRLTVRKTPILGDIPILNFFFTNKTAEKVSSELLIFLTCHVIPQEVPDLTPYEKERYDKLGGKPMKVDGTRALVDSYVHPEKMRDPFYKWRRSK